MEQSLFLQLSIITVFTLIVSTVMRKFKQPLILGYIIAGLLLSQNFLNLVGSTTAISAFSDIGIAFLLFLVGINLNPRHIKEIGTVALLSAVGHGFLSTLLGYFIGIYFGFSPLQALIMGAALTFSSTIIITKILSDMHDLETMYGKIASGFLIIQDLLAMFFLIFLSAVSKGGDLGTLILSTSLRGFGLICLLIAFSWIILPKIISAVAKSQELLMLFSISWCLIIASIFYFLNFSIEIGALFAGITLSVSPYRYEISSKIKALRDFFVMLYFVFIGANMNFGDLGHLIYPIIIFSIFVLIIGPLITMYIIEALGYPKKAAFQVGLSIAQVSEFSLIVGAFAVEYKLLPGSLLSMITLILLLTTIASAYLIQHSNWVYDKFGQYLPSLHTKSQKVDLAIKNNVHDVILLGYSHFGEELIDTLKKISTKLLIVDYDPHIITSLQHKKLPVIYGDISNPITQEEINLDKSKLIISTIKDFTTNLMLIHQVRKTNSNSIILVLANQTDEALKLYEKGANYVIIPNLIGASHTATLISEIGLNLEKFSLEKKKHINTLLIKHQIG